MDFRSKRYFFYKSPQYFLPSFELTGLLVQQKFKIHFQDGRRCGHLEFPIGKILALFDLHVTLTLPTKVQVNSPHFSGEVFQNRFSRSRPPWISIRNVLTNFVLQVITILPTKFRVILAFKFRRRSSKLIYFFYFSSGGHLVNSIIIATLV